MAEPIVYTGGTFDLPHHGHFRFLERASNFGLVVVSLNLNEFAEKYKNKNLVMSYEERRDILMSCKWVHDVVPNVGGDDSKIAIEIVKPNYIAIGSDWARRDYYAQMGFTQDWLDERDIGLVYIPYTKGISSTSIRDRMREMIQKEKDQK